MSFDTYNITHPDYDSHNLPGKFYPDLFLPNFLQWSLAIPGLICNPALVYITYKEKNLHGPCNILLAIGALFDFFYLAGFSVPMFVCLFGINYIPLIVCFYIQVIPMASLFASVNNVLFVGLDWLLNILMPVLYHRINIYFYLTTILAIDSVYSFYALSFGVSGTWSHMNWPVHCAQNDFWSFGNSAQLSTNGFYINSTSFICYIAVWVFFLKFKNNTGIQDGQDEQKRRIFKSVLCIMFLVVGFWMLNVIYTVFLAQFLTDWFSVNYIAPGINLLTVVVASTSNPPILYICSREYRCAFQRSFRLLKLKKWCRNILKTGNPNPPSTTVKLYKNNVPHVTMASVYPAGSILPYH